jgi:hypothetical protein
LDAGQTVLINAPACLLPFGSQALLREHLRERGAIPSLSKFAQHPVDVAQVFCRAAFSNELQLARDDILRRRGDYSIAGKVCLDSVSEAPCVAGDRGVSG